MNKNNIEIERWFVPKYDMLLPLQRGTHIVQGYFAESPAVRVRLERTWWGGKRADITIKGKKVGMQRPEVVMHIPYHKAEALLNLCIYPFIEKTRYRLRRPGSRHPWEIDVFHGQNDGLIKVEVEMDQEDENVVLPSWIYKEVTDDDAYSNKNLAKNPFCNWPKEKQLLGR